MYCVGANVTMSVRYLISMYSNHDNWVRFLYFDITSLYEENKLTVRYQDYSKYYLDIIDIYRYIRTIIYPSIHTVREDY